VTTLVFGNDAPLMGVRETEDAPWEYQPVDVALPEGQKRTATTVVFPDEMGVIDCLKQVDEVLRVHTAAKPAWVAADDETLALLFSKTYDCPVRVYDVEG
jgi:hypothetical protein